LHRLTSCVFLACALAASVARAQPADSTAADLDSVATTTATSAAPVATPPPSSEPKRSLRDRMYFGGSVIVSFGDVTRIGVYPMIGYKFTPKLSLGAEIGYEYLKYDDFDQSGHNYGASVFGNYRIIPQLYAHAEYQLINYEIFTSPTTSERDWVPFFLVGGGLASRVGANTWAFVEVLFDVLQDNNSPYEDGEPIVTAGVSVGF